MNIEIEWTNIIKMENQLKLNNIKEFTIETFLIYNKEHFTLFLAQEFYKQNDQEFKKGNFTSRKDFIISTSRIESFFEERPFKNIEPNYLNSIFVFLPEDKNTTTFNSTQKLNKFYCKDKILYKGPLDFNNILKGNFNSSVLTILLNMDKCTKKELSFDRKKINDLFNKLFSISFNSPLERLEKYNKELLYKTEHEITSLNNLSTFFEEECMKNIKTISNVCSRGKPSKYKLNIYELKKENYKKITNVIHDFLNEIEEYSEIYPKLEPTLNQAQSFFNVLNKTINLYKDEKLIGYNKNDPVMEFFRISTKELKELGKIFQIQNNNTNKRSEDTERIKVIRYQLSQIKNFLALLRTGIEDVCNTENIVIQECIEELKNFENKLESQIKKLLDFFGKILKEQSELLNLISFNENERTKKLNSELLFDTFGMVYMKEKINSINKDRFDQNLSQIGFECFSWHKEQKTLKDPKLLEIIEININDIKQELKIFFPPKKKRTEEEKQLEKEEIERKKEKDKEINEKIENMSSKEKKIQNELIEIIKDEFQKKKIDTIVYKYKMNNINNHIKLSDKILKDDETFFNSEVINDFIYKNKEEYECIFNYLYKDKNDSANRCLHLEFFAKEWYGINIKDNKDYLQNKLKILKQPIN